MSIKSPVIVALDYPNKQLAMAMAERLDPRLCRVKVGKELFTVAGPAVVDELQQLGFEVFLDLKFHDIPNTTSKAVAAAADLGVWMVNVHVSGGRRMMEACREILDKRTGKSPLLIGVTVLTSMEQSDLSEIGLNIEPQSQVLRLATLAKSSGLDGVVCSAQEAEMLKAEVGSDFKLITPGIRLSADSRGDQRRVMTPNDALAAGSDYLVIGRPVTQAVEPVLVLENIVAGL